MKSREDILKDAESMKKTPWAFFVHNWHVTFLILVAIVIGGVMNIVTLPKEADPEVTIPMAAVSIPYPGASPADVEKLVTDRMEERLASLANVKSISSASREGLSSIMVEFEASADLDTSLRDLRSKVEDASALLPENALDPVVTEIRLDDTPIITFSLLGNVAPDALKAYGEAFQRKLEEIPGISDVQLYGLEREEMQVLVDRKALEGYGLSIGQIVSAIRANHADAPIGSLLADEYYYQATLDGQFRTPEDLLELPVASVNGQNVHLRDIALVRRAFGETESASRMFVAENGEEKRSVTLQVRKRTGGNILNIIDAAKKAAADFERSELPKGLSIVSTNDYSVYIRDDIRTLGQNGLQTIGIIFLIFLFAIGVREAIVTSLSIPFIFLIAFLGLGVLGETLNSLVLFSLILSLGLIVDTSIVIMEGVHEHMKRYGLSASDAALLSIKTYRAPLLSSTLTTVSAFVPMAMMSGITGEFVKHIPITVTLALSASLFVALLLLPAMAVRAFRHFDPKKPRKEPLMSRLMVPLRRAHRRLLDKTIPSRRRRWAWVLGMLVAFGLALALPLTGVLKAQLFPQVDLEFFLVNIELPVGSTLADTDAAAMRVEERIKKLPHIDNYVTVLGASSDITFTISSVAGSNKANITVTFVPKEERDMASYDISDLLRQDLKGITNAKIDVVQLAAGPPTGAPVEVRVYGDTPGHIEIAAKDIEAELKAIPGAYDVSTDIERGTGEFTFTLKRDQLSYYGLTASQVANELRTAVFGNDSIKIIRDGKETPIVVRMDFRDPDCVNDPVTKLLETRDRVTLCASHPTSVADIENLLVPTPQGSVPVGRLADIRIRPSVTAIRHDDRDNIVSVRAYNRADVPVVDITAALQEKLKDKKYPDDVRIAFGGETEEVTESFQSLWNALIVGIILIVFFLVLQFKSYRQPFIIMFTLPMAFIGVFFGLALIGRNFSFPGFIGLVALAGVVVNDAIVLIDRINNNIAAGYEKAEAVIHSAGERLQPIILTSITTAAGVLPLAFANELWGDLAWTIVFGITFSTILTLILVPILYMMIERDRKPRTWFRALLVRLARTAEY